MNTDINTLWDSLSCELLATGSVNLIDDEKIDEIILSCEWLSQPARKVHSWVKVFNRQLQRYHGLGIKKFLLRYSECGSLVFEISIDNGTETLTRIYECSQKTAVRGFPANFAAMYLECFKGKLPSELAMIRLANINRG